MVLELHNHRLQPKVIALLKQYRCLQNIPYSREKLISLIYSDKKRIRDSIDWIELVSLGKATLKSRLLSSVINQLPERIDL
jgi:3-dehydroquinate synthetase